MSFLDACPKIYFGRHSLDYLELLPAGKTLLVCDPFMVESGIVRKVTDRLDHFNREYVTFADVEPDPSIGVVTSALQMLFREKPDNVIALGGGSAIDTAKAVIYFCMKYKGLLMGQQYIHSPFFVAVPTTSGTGSEVTSYTVLTDRENDVKIPLNDRCMTPDVAILDPIFTKTLPKPMVAYTGMDVLTHALESYVTPCASSFTDMYAVAAARGTLRWLPAVFSGDESDAAHQEMMISSTMAGLAFSNSGLGICHGIAHTIGADFHVPHGKANSIILPYAIAFNAGIGLYIDPSRPNALGRYGRIAGELGFIGDDKDQAAQLVLRVLALNEQFGTPLGFAANGIDPEVFAGKVPDMVQKILRDITTSANPVTVTPDDVERLLDDILHGRNPLDAR